MESWDYYTFDADDVAEEMLGRGAEEYTAFKVKSYYDKSENKWKVVVKAKRGESL